MEILYQLNVSIKQVRQNLILTSCCLLGTLGLLIAPFFAFGDEITSTIVNPATSTQHGVSISVVIPGATPTPTPTPEPPTENAPPFFPVVPPIPVERVTIIFKGFAYPEAFISIYRDGLLAATLEAGNNGIFEGTLTGVTAGFRIFSLFAEDNEGRISKILRYNLNLLPGAIYTISGIIFPPTIELSLNNIARGESLEALGQAFPNSRIDISIERGSTLLIKDAATNSLGRWHFTIDSKVLNLDTGNYFVKAKAMTPDGGQSDFSEELFFEISLKPVIRPPKACQNGDLNGDGKVNIVDFSIMLYWWDTDNFCADQNKDGIVGIADFSIMLYYWTG